MKKLSHDLTSRFGGLSGFQTQALMCSHQASLYTGDFPHSLYPAELTIPSAGALGR
jgi:hypothetical protein